MASKSLGNLSAGLVFRFTMSGHAGDLNQAVSFVHEAYEICPEAHTFSEHFRDAALSKPWIYSNSAEDLLEAAHLQELNPPGHPYFGRSISPLAIIEFNDSAYLSEIGVLYQEWEKNGNRGNRSRVAYTPVFSTFSPRTRRTYTALRRPSLSLVLGSTYAPMVTPNEGRPFVLLPLRFASASGPCTMIKML